VARGVREGAWMSEGAGEGRERRARVVLVDDQDLIRFGLRSVLSQADVEIVGEASSGREALEISRRLKPDLVVMDIEMPEMDGLQATREIKAELPTTSVLILTSHDEPEYLLEAVRAGAAGYVLKSDVFVRLTEAVERVLSGENSLDSGLAVQLLLRLPEGAGHEEKGPSQDERRQGEALAEALTERELEILRLVAGGKTNQQMAQDLFLSVGTVKSHVHRVISKLGVSDRTQAAVLAIRLGLAPSDR
jgi:two-component system, NarL family, response regulator LiaR